MAYPHAIHYEKYCGLSLCLIVLGVLQLNFFLNVINTHCLCGIPLCRNYIVRHTGNHPSKLQCYNFVLLHFSMKKTPYYCRPISLSLDTLWHAFVCCHNFIATNNVDYPYVYYNNLQFI